MLVTILGLLLSLDSQRSCCTFFPDFKQTFCLSQLWLCIVWVLNMPYVVVSVSICCTTHRNSGLEAISPLLGPPRDLQGPYAVSFRMEDRELLCRSRLILD